MNQYEVIIIGAGAAGLMCAIEAGKRGRKTLIIDHSKTVGEKIRISGGGRCNFTNIHTSPENFLSENPRFCISALKRYTQNDFISLVKKHKIRFHEKTLGQLFCDDSSKHIIDMLLDECAKAKVHIRLNTKVTGISKNEDIFTLQGENEVFTCNSLVIATGGLSIPKIGATAFGYEVAKQFGLNVIPPRAGLVPFTLGEQKLSGMKELSGVAVDVIVSCNGKSFKEAMLFTHRGLSGPAILQISSYWRGGDKISINLSPERNIAEHLKECRAESPRSELHSALSRILPKRLAMFICEENNYLSANNGTIRLCDLSNQMMQDIADNIHNWQIIPDGTEGYRTAEVTLGGVDTDELSSKTFETKKVSGLFFIGEVVDVTGHLGGYNFQWAWSSGHACGQFV